MKPDSRAHHASAQRGFSLVEVLVALIVLSVGLLGIAKMQALALSSSSVAGRRALAALEVASLADSMHVNRAYWGVTASGATFTITGSQVNTPPVAGLPICEWGQPAAPCDAPTLASYDLDDWASHLAQLLPGDQATIACNTNTPIECLITVSWSEQAVGLNNATAQTSAGSAITNNTYTLYVEP